MSTLSDDVWDRIKMTSAGYKLTTDQLKIVILGTLYAINALDEPTRLIDQAIHDLEEERRHAQAVRNLVEN